MLFPVAGSVFLSPRSLCSSQQEITRNLFFLTNSLFDFKLHENLIQSRILEPVQSTPAHLHFRSARLHDLSELGKNSYASSSFDCLGFALDPSQERSGNVRKKSRGRREISQLAACSTLLYVRMRTFWTWREAVAILSHLIQHRHLAPQSRQNFRLGVPGRWVQGEKSTAFPFFSASA